MLLFSLVANGITAHAANGVGDPLDATVAHLIPQIEAIAGRPFGTPPSIEWVSRQEYRERLIEEAGSPWFDDAHRRLDDSDVVAMWGTLGRYLPKSDTILLMRDGLNAIQKAGDLAPEEVDGRFRCLLVHELMHALHDRHVPEVDYEALDVDALRGLRLLSEGHATWVEGEWCRKYEGPVMAEQSNSVVQVRSSLSANDDLTAYAWGAPIIGALNHRGGHEAVWRAVTGRPPSYFLLQVAMSPALQPGWTDGAALDLAIRSLVIKPGYGQTSTSAAEYLARTLGIRTDGWEPVSEAGIHMLGGFRHYSVSAAAFVMSDAEMANDTIEARIRQAKNWRTTMPTLEHRGVPKVRSVSIESQDELSERPVRLTLITFETDFVPCYELWVAEGRRLTHLSTYGIKRVNPKRLKTAMTIMMAGMPEAMAPGQVWDQALAKAFPQGEASR
ncbi:MAG: hypothetical protein AAGA48_40470 [Myxococcota bacterium]